MADEQSRDEDRPQRPLKWDGSSWVPKRPPQEYRKDGADELPFVNWTAVRKTVSSHKAATFVVAILLLVGLVAAYADILGYTDDHSSGSTHDRTKTVANPCSDEVLEAPYKTGSKYWNVDQRAEREQACFDAIADRFND